jgi:LAS superfamily LD-carboxypeptidase LdcB
LFFFGFANEPTVSLGHIPVRDYLMGQFSPTEHTDLFSKLPSFYCPKDKTIYLRQDCLAAFSKMANAATKDGVHLTVVSGFRSFEDQKSIWDNKYLNLFAKHYPDPLERVKKILEYSAMPGSSRHHWGTDFDLNSVDPAYFETEAGKKIYAWLVKNASTYGFVQPYTKGRSRGYHEEKWHWSYAPVSKSLLKSFSEHVTEKDFSHFQGSQFAPDVHIMADYVFGINSQAK